MVLPLKIKRLELSDICRRYSVRRLELFGSGALRAQGSPAGFFGRPVDLAGKPWNEVRDELLAKLRS
jgi:hypothetical protein